MTQNLDKRSILEMIKNGQVTSAEGSRLLKQIAGREAPPAIVKEAHTDIAVIGLSGKYPLARDLHEFWERLASGTNCITEVPQERWDLAQYYHPDKLHPGTSYSKWGGFLDEVDRFDPLFFNISPVEAELIDPQERLFLEKVWEALEDAAYTREELARGAVAASVGVFVGCIYRDYPLLANSAEQAAFLSITPHYSIANRVSNFFNFGGPSVVLNTACSASLTALHFAAESIRQGRCDVAIAGGVNLHLHPNRFLGLSQIGLLGADGVSRSLGVSDGFVLGEGIGVAVLKPLAKAEKDGDHIYGVIKASGINHNGGASAYGAPNPQALQELVQQVLQQSGIEPRSLSYVEVAANGSELGDAMEVAGWSDALQREAVEQQSCPIGTVKSNLGNIEAASGIAQLTKVLLQMQHKKLVPSLHADPPNASLNMAASPFYIQDRLAEWRRPQLERAGVGQEVPLRAAISSLGIGGANALLIVEEYRREENQTVSSDRPERPLLFVFSAKNQNSLRALVEKMRDFFARAEESSLSDVAYTLQVGREAMKERLAILARNRAELFERLTNFLEGVPDSRMISGKASHSEIYKSPEWRSKLQSLIAQQDWLKLAEVWTRGGAVDWRAIDQTKLGKRVSLPTYAFQRNRCWLPESEPAATVAPTAATATAATATATQAVVATETAQAQFMLRQTIASILKIDAEEIELDVNLKQYGMDSLVGMRLVNHLQKTYQQTISVRSFFALSTVEEIAEYLIGEGLFEAESGELAPERQERALSEPAVEDRFYTFLLSGLSKGMITPDQAQELESEWMRTGGRAR